MDEIECLQTKILMPLFDTVWATLKVAKAKLNISTHTKKYDIIYVFVFKINYFIIEYTFFTLPLYNYLMSP